MGLDNEFDLARSALHTANTDAAEARRLARSAALAAAAAPGDEHLQAQARQAHEASAAADHRRAIAFDSFDVFTDPRTRSLMSQPFPLLLLPVRVETRFIGNELLVRIFPDECSVDSFDPELSRAEVDSGARFWREYWRAGGVTADERSAFTALTGGYGTGRASWIVNDYRPVNDDDRPTGRDPATDLILVVAGPDLPAEAQRPALADYWIAVWKADGAPTALASARTALDTAIGNTATAAALIAQYAPFNIADPPPAGKTHAETNVTFAWLQLPDTAGEDHSGWRRAPMAALLPERFVVMLHSGTTVRSVLGGPISEPLYVGPDPAGPPEDRITPHDDGTLSIPDPLSWMFDFPAAEQAGMGIRIALTPAEVERGFDRIVVIGVRLSCDAADGKTAFEELLTGHHFSRAGLELLPQGAPTNNTDDAPSAWSRRDNPDLAFDDAFGPEKFTEATDPLEQRDGQVFARLLGIDSEIVKRVRGADGRDAIEARAINTALAPGTLSYLAGVLMNPVFHRWVDDLERFFTRYVSGRGAIPALRIGTQPYGIVASTAFSRIAWLSRDSAPPPGTVPPPVSQGRMLVSPTRPTRFLVYLHAVLNALQKYWTDAAATVAHVGDGQDPHKTLLDILGLHPGSAEFHSRRGKSLDELSSRWNLARLLGIPSEKYRATQQRRDALALLRSLGYSGPEPDLLDLFFMSGQSQLKGPLIEDLPLSETEALQPVTGDGRNYLQWLADAAEQSLDTLRRQQGFAADSPPRTLLYIMAHFALTRGYQDAGTRLRFTSGLWSDAELAQVIREPKSVHVNTINGTDSPWRHLYDADRRLTGSPAISVADHLTASLALNQAFTASLGDQIAALRALADTPTARLERGLVEHIDTLTYRFDAWRLGFVRYQLDLLRRGIEGPRTGLYVGAYGWLENVRPKHENLTEPQLPPDLAEAFAQGPPLRVDPSNGGHLHAPSMNQAFTAAVLRAGSLANLAPGKPNAFAINLASAPVRTARSLFEGVRSGQNLGALLGYRFERALHDAGGFVELDALIFAFRRVFPLIADKLKPTQNPPTSASEAIEARNVVDGLALIRQASQPATNTYPYGKTLPALGNTERGVVEKAVADIVASFDAMADLAVAEGVHQATQNNPERAASYLDIAGNFTAPRTPRVIETPATGFALTCRVGVELDATAAGGTTPRAKAQPQLNKWLSDVLPPVTSVGCTVAWTPPDGAEQTRTVRLSDLALAPIDVIYIVADEGGAGLGILDDLVRRHVIDTAGPRPDMPLQIRYTQPGTAALSVFVVSAFATRLRSAALASRPLRASDVAPPSTAAAPDKIAHIVARARIADVVADLATVRTDLDTALTAGKALFDDPAANRAALLAGIDDRITTAATLLRAVSRFGGSAPGWGSFYTWRASQFSALIDTLTALLNRWTTRLAAAQQALADEAALPAAATDADRLRLLRAAETQVSTAVTPELTPATLRPVVQGKVDAFDAQADAVRTNAVQPSDPRLSDRLARCTAIGPITDFDTEPLDFAEAENAVIAYWQDLQTVLTAARGEVDKRHAAGTAALAAHDGAVDDEARLTALQDAATAIFGEGFQLLPAFTPSAAAGAEQTAAHTHFTSGALLAHAKAVLNVDNPLDTWLYGCARVRTKLRLLEDLTMLAEAHGRDLGQLSAMQLPHNPGAPWVALDFPKEDTPDGERLAYVALTDTSFNPAGQRCGLLLDDWSEVIPVVEPDEPGPQHTTGLAFHFDRPSQEPPQSILMLTPATWNGAWSWGDIVGGIDETFALARIRAVEPSHLDDTALAQFLPATVASVTTSGLLLAANYALLNVKASISRGVGDG